MREDSVEDVVGGYLTGDFAQVVKDAADIFAYKVAAEVAINSLKSIAKGLMSALQCRVVAHICDNDTPRIKTSGIHNRA